MERDLVEEYMIILLEIDTMVNGKVIRRKDKVSQKCKPGINTLENGIIFITIQRSNGRKNGSGTYLFANGDIYEGYFVSGLRYLFNL